MKIMELGHIVLTVSDLAASTHFYRDILASQYIQTFPPPGSDREADRSPRAVTAPGSSALSDDVRILLGTGR
jgi:catechol 2,3-dioxygenase-like lactoylglutathione lyase family enzyme